MTASPFGSRTFEALLFDMDGTIINSLAVTERVWGSWAARQGLDVQAFLSTIHGVRAVENIAMLGLPGVDPQSEADAIERAEMVDVAGIVEIPGAGAFLSALPPDRWAVVTSATRQLALMRLEAAGLPIPSVLVAAEDVERGKPAPDCFLLGARQLGREIGSCLVFEDAPAGIQAAEAAGAAVAVVTATYRHPISTDHPRFADYVGLTPGHLLG